VIVLDGRTLLVAASETRGALVYEFDFDHVVGLEGVSVLASDGSLKYNGRPSERIFAASSGDRALVSLIHFKGPALAEGDLALGNVSAVSAVSSPPRAMAGSNIMYQWQSVASMAPMTVRRDVVTRGAQEVLGLESPRVLSVECGVRQAKVAHREYVDQEICYVDVTGGADRDELACDGFPPIPAPTRALLDEHALGSGVPEVRAPVCQAVSFVLEEVPSPSNNPMLFEEAPVILRNGTLSFRLRPLQFGVSRQRIRLQDSGGQTSVEKIVVIEVLTVNHAPFFTLANLYGGQDAVLGEQEMVFAPAVSPGAPHEMHQTLTWLFTYTNPQSFRVPPALTTRPSVVNPGALVGVITYTPAGLGAFVSEFKVELVDSGPVGTTDGSNNTSPKGIFLLTLLTNNNPPRLISITGLRPAPGVPAPEVVYSQHDAKAPPVVHTLEDGGLVSLAVEFNKGHAREGGQRVFFSLVSVEEIASAYAGDELFKRFAASSTTQSPAQLSFETSQGYNGKFLVNVAMTDDGGVANFGNNRTVFSFELHVKPRTSFPAYVLRRGVSEVETSVATEMVRESVLGNFTSLPDDEITRALSFVVLSNSAPWLFAKGPEFRIDGSAVFTLAPGRSGVASVSVALKNDRQVFDTLRSVVVPFQVEPVNSPPTATIPAHLAVVEQEAAVEQHLVGVIHDVLPGPFYDEWNTQAVSFRVTFVSSSTGLFVTPPFVVMEEGSGHVHTNLDIPHLPPHTLRFTSAPGVHGVAEVSLVPYDNGGVARGGSDTGQTLTTQLKVYPRPRVRAVYPRIGTVWGEATVTVHGDFFGSTYSRGYVLEAGGKYSNVSVQVGGRTCEHVDVISDSELRCVAPPGRGCANISVTIIDGSLTRSGHLSCGYVYTELLFAAVQDVGTGVLALGPKDGEATGAQSALFDLVLSKAVLALHMLEGGSQVLLGGSFLTAGEVRVNHIARYDGHVVHKLGNGE